MVNTISNTASISIGLYTVNLNTVKLHMSCSLSGVE